MTQDFLKWLIQFCYENYVLTTVFLLAISCIKPLSGIVQITYNFNEEDEKDDK